MGGRCIPRIGGEHATKMKAHVEDGNDSLVEDFVVASEETTRSNVVDAGKEKSAAINN